MVVLVVITLSTSSLVLRRVSYCPACCCVLVLVPHTLSLYHNPFTNYPFTLPHPFHLQVPTYLITTRPLVVVGWCLLAHPRNQLVLQPRGGSRRPGGGDRRGRGRSRRPRSGGRWSRNGGRQGRRGNRHCRSESGRARSGSRRARAGGG